ncbi:lysophospholipid transporter LplT [Ramlibacter sp.]|uniref:lysophospholipid transporter LplT n=1 Tax=Ramlibacter sp. TaxID=1917967 RepID=UPI0017B59388|nr:lysophospholipid transporter LplT [Ramlibacter sp.]MBA2674202.1 lysophospholipid transporter LplT [Ramlibacter sp.]
MTGTAIARRSLRWVAAGQFLGALADNALLLVSIEVLAERHAQEWAAPALRIAFYGSYVLLSAFSGAVADAVPKKWVLFATNLLKLCGCALLLTQAHPLVAYALVGIGAAAHAPARYGILGELADDGALVSANAWIEISTVTALLAGVAWGSWLLRGVAALPAEPSRITFDAILALGAAYLLAALCALPIRGAPASNPRALDRPGDLLRHFGASVARLWNDPAARMSLSVTCVFWSAAAVLQFVVLRWAAERLLLSLPQAGLLQGAVAVGMIAGAAAAGRWIREERAAGVQPLGIALGLSLLLMAWVDVLPAAVLLLWVTGALSGLLLVPMNAVLQRSGLALMHGGQSIAVQNFSENLASLAGLAAYGIAVALQVALAPTLIGMGLAVCAAMLPWVAVGGLARSRRRNVP